MAGKLHPKQLAQAGATNGQVLAYNTTSGQWGPANASAQKVECVSIINGTNPYMSTSSSSYVLASDYIFRGTGVMGTPASMKVVAWADSGATCAVSVYDLTNAKTICENANITGTTKAVVDLGTLSNLPSGEALWEIRIKRAAGSGNAKVYVSSFITGY